MRKFIACAALSTFLILISLPAWAQRGGHFGGHASMGSGISASSMGRGGFESREPDFQTVRRGSSTNMQMRSNARLRTHGLERAEDKQSADTRADSKRGFTIAPGVEKAEAKHSSRMHSHRRSNASLKMRGHERAGDSESVEVGESTHTSLGGKIKHRLHL